jgi:ABC-type Fe3+/spermidine/putrescine transport system ATPase subunit
MLSIKGVKRSFGDKPVLKGIDLEISEGEILCLLGPSGCGKTTLLRIIAGLEKADSGDVALNGKSIMRVPIHARDFGLMFQDFALFPHMNVAQNIAFGLRMHHVARVQQEQRVREVLELVGLTGFEKRDVTSLSGGERQRVALARSLAPNPRLLMLDEPLGSLDAALRERLVVELREIIKQVGLTAVYVTHDQREAFAIADRIAVMNAGHIEQIDSPQTLYLKPATIFAAQFLGLRNIFPVTGREAHRVQTTVGSFDAPETTQAILLHPDSLQWVNHESPDSVSAVIQERVFLGDFYRFQAKHSSGTFITFKLPAIHPMHPNVGDLVFLKPSVIIPL